MAAVRCPKCGALYPAAAGGRLARCLTCRESLRRCRYCRHYDHRQLDCVHSARATHERIVDADEVLNCPDFATGLVTRPVRGIWARLRTPLVGVAVGLGLMLCLIRLVGPRSAPPPIELRTSVGTPDSIFQEELLEIKVLVCNEADHPAKDVRVVLSGRSMRGLLCQSVDPPEAFEEATAQYASAWVGDLESGQIGGVTFRFSASGTGKLDLAAHVTAANLPVPSVTPVHCEIVP